MQRIGRVLHISSSKNVVLKAENVPRIGDKVVNENLKSVGMVFDVFGPTSSPYVVVKTSMGDPHSLVDRFLYTVPSKSRMRGRRKRR